MQLLNTELVLLKVLSAVPAFQVSTCLAENNWGSGSRADVADAH